MKEKILIDKLKSVLKSKGVTYEHVSNVLGISLATVKRDFSVKNLTVKRLLKICDAFNISPNVLFAEDDSLHRKEYKLTIEEEVYFSKNIKCWGFFDLLLSGCSVASIRKKYKLKDQDVLKYLKKLDQFGLIEWHPNNEVKIQHFSISWRDNGPLRKVLLKLNETSFLNSNFKGANDFYSFFVDEIPKKSIKKVVTELKKIEDLIEVESQVGMYNRGENETIGIMMSVRPWNYNPFEEKNL